MKLYSVVYMFAFFVFFIYARNVTCILSPKQILFNKSDEVSGNIPPFVLTTCNQSSQPEGQLLNGLITELKLAYGIVKLTVTNSATTDKQIMYYRQFPRHSICVPNKNDSYLTMKEFGRISERKYTYLHMYKELFKTATFIHEVLALKSMNLSDVRENHCIKLYTTPPYKTMTGAIQTYLNDSLCFIKDLIGHGISYSRGYEGRMTAMNISCGARVEPCTIIHVFEKLQSVIEFDLILISKICLALDVPCVI